MAFHVPEQCRIREGALRSDATAGNNGAFQVPRLGHIKYFLVRASDRSGWERVSVSLPTRCPLWEEMSQVKLVFWDPEDVVIQYHPARSQHVNVHPYCLYLWRPIGTVLPVPPSFLVD
jgi:hypothetical protein